MENIVTAAHLPNPYFENFASETVLSHYLQGYTSAPIKLTKFSFGTVLEPIFKFDELKFEINPLKNINMATVFLSP